MERSFEIKSCVEILTMISNSTQYISVTFYS